MNREGVHGIRIPGQVLDQIRSKEESGAYGLDSRFKKRKSSGKTVSRKEKRKDERKLKKQKKLGTHGGQGHQQNRREPPKSEKFDAHKSQDHSDDPMAALRALKAKKAGAKPVAELRIVKEDSLDDPMAALKALKAKKAGSKPTELRIVKEDALDDSFSSEDMDLDGESDFGAFSDDDLDDAEDPMEALKALKAKKNPLGGDVRVVKEDELDDELSSDDFDGSDLSGGEDFSEDNDFDGESDDGTEDPLAKLKALKEAKRAKPSEEDDTWAQLKAMKEAKKAKETGKSPDGLEELKAAKKATKAEKKIEATFVDPLENDMEFYAKKLGLKNGKRSKLSKTDDHDSIGGLLDGLDFDNLSPEESGEGSDFGLELGSEDDFDVLDDEDGPKENPFVAPVTETVDEVEEKSKYIPPALRRKLAMEANGLSEETIALQKSLKGPLNKLSETNIGTIVNEINGLFLTNPRQAVNENLTSVLLDSVTQQGRLLDTFVCMHSALVVAIYRLQGVDFGAHFIQSLVEKFESYRADPTKTKEALNSVALLSSVYSFQLVSAKLLYDIIRDLLQNLTESSSELLLKIVRNSGNQMRTDDPSALKEIVLQVTKKSSDMHKDLVSTRMQFLLETITTLKNNKLKDNNEATHQLTIRLKKFLGNFAGKTTDPLQVGLDDIRNVATRGKWWLVGSAWKGNADGQPEVLANIDAMNDILDNAEPNWLELAKSQRMNTDIRRAIFISIMSANDYIDAVTKLDKLALKKAQEREIPRILIHCAVVEPAWNPYYGVLAAKLCDSHAYRKTFQFMLWDLVKSFDGSAGYDDEEEEEFSGFDMDGDNDDKLKKFLNLGRLYGYLFAEGSLQLHILRTINFVAASPDTKMFLEVLFVTFLDHVARKSQVQAVGMSKAGNKSMSEQKFDDRILIERLLKAKEQPNLLKGIQHFASKRLRNSDFITGKKQRARVQWGLDSMKDIIDEFVNEYSF